MKEYQFNMINPFFRMKEEIDRMRYYEGFKVERDKQMFEGEIKDCKEFYQKLKESAQENIDDIQYNLVHYMKLFIENVEKVKEYDEKLSALKYKLGEE